MKVIWKHLLFFLRDVGNVEDSANFVSGGSCLVSRLHSGLY